MAHRFLGPLAAVTGRLVLPAAPVLLLSAALLAAAWGLQAPWLGGMAAWLVVAAFGLLVAPFWCHEMGHLVALLLCRGVHSVDVQATAWRVSLQPCGELTRAQAALVALAGPGTSILVGAVLLLLGHHVTGAVFLAHVVFLLPCFGDGRALRAALGQPAGSNSSICSTM